MVKVIIVKFLDYLLGLRAWTLLFWVLLLSISPIQLQAAGAGDGLCIESVTPSNYQLVSDVWEFDLNVELSYQSAPETSVTFNGASRTLAGVTGTETFSFIGIPVVESVTASFPASPTDLNHSDMAVVPAPAAVSCDGANDVGGTIFRDFDADGIQDAFEYGYGVSGMHVVAYDSDNDEVASQPVSVDGSFRFAGVSEDLPLRLEFRGLPDWLEFGAVGGASSSGVAFVSATTCDLDVPVQNPTDYVGATPTIALACYVNGDPTGGGTSGSSDWFVGLPYTPAGDGTGTGMSENDYLADGTTIGATWGVAYHRATEKIFAAAMMKRHSGLGTGGTGAIYQIDPASPKATAGSLFINLSASPFNIATDVVGGTPRSTLPVNKVDPNTDPDAFDAVGKVGLGGMDLSDDEETLWVMNLFDQTLYEIEIGATATAPTTAAGVIGHALPDPSDATGGFRPWAVKFRDGLVYVGGVTSGETGGAAIDLKAFVYVHDPDGVTGNFTELLQFPLNYLRGYISRSSSTDHTDAEWNVWIDEWDDIVSPAPGAATFSQTIHPQPILSDLEFDEKGALVLGFVDRLGHQIGNDNYSPSNVPVNVGYEGAVGGDILRACQDEATGEFVLESAGGCGGINSMDTAVPPQGPGGAEFYKGDWYQINGSNTPSNGTHQEVGLGGLVTALGQGNVAMSAFDPVDAFRAGGVAWLRHSDGDRDYDYEIFGQDAGTARPASFGKAAGLGDIAILGDISPLIVGNRVWDDANGNGVQDAGESGLAGVTVTLICGTQSATVVTATDNLATDWDESGEFYFSNASGANAENVLVEGERCYLSVSLADPNLGLRALTLGTEASNDVHDNDAIVVGLDAVIAFTAGAAGENDYDQDFGFSPPYDFGDLPEGGSYDFPTAGGAAGDRPRHTLGSGLSLGATVDGERDGQPSLEATGDGSDEDGVVVRDLFPGATETFNVQATVPGGSATVYLNAWIDFNSDGDFDSGEQIADDVVMSDGDNAISFNVPSDASRGLAYARFRLSTDSGLGATGDASDGEVEDYLLTILEPQGAIGNYVWLDEDSNGLQDAGEPGIPRVEVTLFLDPDGNGIFSQPPMAVATTRTDSEGGYLFTGLAAGLYYVQVADDDNGGLSTLPGQLTQTTSYGNGDFTNKDDTAFDFNGFGYRIILGEDEVNKTADFGYNWNPTDDVLTPSGIEEATIGDLVWLDADQDGLKDPNEVGIAGVTLSLMRPGLDGLFGTADDVTEATDTTDDGGYYIFDSLDPDAYQVIVTDTGSVLTGYTQTADPDTTAGLSLPHDGQTTAPIVIAPGDVYINADFGYYIAGLGQVGDTVWLDADGSGGASQGSEPGIPGVTVTLIGDSDRDGVWDQNERVLATDTTDSSGAYLFSGLSLTDGSGQAGYLVWVNDTEAVLQGLAQTYDHDSELDNLSAAVLSAVTPSVLTEDFSYTAVVAPGSIGDTIWADLDGGGGTQDTQGGEPGIEGLTVSLYTSGPDGSFGNGDDVLVESMQTNSLGQYLFTNLELQAYQVRVTTSGLSSIYNPVPSFDADGGADSISDVILTDANRHDRQQDFSYAPSASYTLASVGDTIYIDTDGDGAQDVAGADGNLGTSDDEPGVPFVLVELLDSAGALLETTVTDEAGNYLFSGLAAGDYTVRVVTPPSGYTQTQDPDSALSPDNKSAVTLAANTHDRVQDFGYQPASGTLFAIGNTIWLDVDDSGSADDPTDGAGSEPGISGVRVELYGEGADATIGSADDVLLATRTTDENGYYLFAGLPGSVDYRVVVDTATLPLGVSRLASYERDGGSDSETTVLNLSSNQLAEDFSYPYCSAIGDTVFFDMNANDQRDSGELGLAGVTVNLLDNAGAFVASAVTDLNGRYFFDCLNEGTYTVTVDATSLPPGLKNTADPDATENGSTVIVLPGGTVDLTADFGYSADDGLGLGSIGTLVWQDENADAINDSPVGPDATASTDDDEPVIADVTLDLYLDVDGDCLVTPADLKIAEISTNGSTGTNYLFENLPVTDGDSGGASYLVNVTDRAGVLNGYWHTSTTGSVDNTSKPNAYCVSLTSAATSSLVADFGYYQHGACTGNYVWQDRNADGDQDVNDDGINDVEVTLVVTYPTGHRTTVKAISGDDPSTSGTTEAGFYAFCNLLLDENYREASATKDVAEAGKPAFTLSVDPYQAVLSEVSPTAVYAANSGTATVDRTDSDDGLNGTKANPLQGITGVGQLTSATNERAEASYDFGYVSFDYGDLPEGGSKDFPTAGSTSTERARHVIGSGVLLGTTVDAESNGTADVNAAGDGADEDGFAYLPDLTPGDSYAVPYTATIPSGSPTVYLNAWIDFNCNGDFELSEQIADSDSVVNGTNRVTFSVPSEAIPGRAYARFRLSTVENLDFSGDAPDGEVEDYVVHILKPIGAIGNYVWFDENSDGFQDAGEVGMPDVLVNLLYDADGAGAGAPVAVDQTITDANGGYLFDGLPAGLYYVDVDESSFYDPDDAGPAGLSQTTLYTNGNGDFGNKDHRGDGYAVQLGANAYDPTADFGYNWEPTSEVNTPTAAATGTIGDRVWIDADRNGRQDPGEVGIPDVYLELCAASDPTTVLAVEATKANGCYVFDQLAPDAYLVKIAARNYAGGGALVGLTQYGDPDHFGATGTNDGRTTTPIVLGPGDVFLNVDFGYDDGAAPTDAATDLGRIGDRVWLDANVSADATEGVKSSALEPGLSGVSVALIGDKNRDGIWDLDGADNVLGGTGNSDDELVLATAVTDASGCYLFDGLPLDDGSGQAGYIVFINDTGNVLQGLTATFDPDGVLDNQTAVTLSTVNKEALGEDFSYAVAEPLGSIGNTIWADLDNSGGDETSKGPEPGIAGLTVNLYTAGVDGAFGTGDDVLRASTTTNSRGQYLFSGLPYQAYQVVVDTAGLSSDFIATPSYDADGGSDSRSLVTLTALDPHDREQDFSYPSSGSLATASIGDTVYFDLNGGSIQDLDGLDNILGTSDDEPGIQGVIMELIQSGSVVATTVTDEDGKYLFSGLAPGTYTVKVATPPQGYAQTQDPDGGADHESEETLAAGDANRAQDFGYQPPSGNYYAIGNTIWLDQDASGTADDPTSGTNTEPGLEGVRVVLTTKGGDGTFGTSDDVTEGIRTTDGDGYYLFAGLEGGRDYRVTVDTGTLPEGVSPGSTYENDGVSDSVTTVTNLASNVLTEDFSYPYCGGLGDTVYFDLDRDGTQDPGDAGLSGVLVSLKVGGTTLATATTDSNGRYYFDCLPAGNYEVEVTSGLPSGFINTGDPDLTKDGSTTVVLGAGAIHLTSDFGYSGDEAVYGSIGTLVWRDENADGDDDASAGAGIDDDEPSIAGVTVDLFYDVDGDCLLEPGEPKLATATTTGTASDNYLFDFLPIDDGDLDMSYIVKVTDVDEVLLGYWHSLDPSHDGDNSSANDANGTSKPDPYCATLSAARPDEVNADFGYYVDPACLGNYVWIDANGDGRQDLAETGINGVTVELSISYPNGATINLTSVTGDNPKTTGTTEVGYYEFCNLLLDEDFRVTDSAPSGANPFMLLSVDATQVALDGYGPTLIDEVASDFEDSDNPYGTIANPVMGLTDTSTQTDPTTEQAIASYDFGVATDADDDDLADVGDFDPQGYFYAEGTGQIIPGGSVSITPPTGGTVTIVQDGASGEYRWFGSDVEGVYTMTITPPAGWIICRLPTAGNGTDGGFDPTLGSTDNQTSANPVDLGSEPSVTNPGFLESAPLTPYYVKFDLQKDDPLVISNNIPLKKDPETTFAAWASNFGLTGDDALPLPSLAAPDGGNPDDDIYNNVLEYALCGHPTQGITSHHGFCIEVNTGGGGDTLEAVIRRPNSGLTDVTYTLQGRTTLPTVGDTVWTDLISFAPGVTTGATVTDLGDGSEELLVADIAGATVDPTDVLTNQSGFVRLTVSLSSGGDTFTESTMVQGWKETAYATDECATFANPFTKKEALSGVIDGVLGTHQLDLTTSFGTLNLGGVLDFTNKSYYIEIIEGDQQGHRFDVTAAGHGQLTVATDADVCAGPPHNTLDTGTALPASIAGDRFIMREHYTLEETFPPAAPFIAGADSSVADRILVYTSTGYDVYYLDSEQVPNVWLLDGSDLVDDGNTVLSPSQGLFLHPRVNPVTMFTIGVVRENAFCMPLNSGYTLMAGGFPMNQSIADRGLTAIAQGGLESSLTDQVHFWTGDTAPYVEGYACYFRLSGAPVASGITDRWVDIADANLTSQDATAGLFEFDRSAFYLRRLPGCEEGYCQPLPWLP